MSDVILLKPASVMTLSPPIMARIYTLISLIGCDVLKVALSFVIVHNFLDLKKEDLKIQ